MTRDELLTLGLVLSFASLLTAHVGLSAGLATRVGPARALAAFLLFPLAPVWGAHRGMHARVVSWTVSALAYAVFQVLSRR